MNFRNLVRLSSLLLAFPLLCLLSSESRADSVVITNGSASVTGSASNFSFDFGGTNFSVRGGESNVFASFAAGLWQPGQSVNLGSAFRLSDSTGSATINGISFDHAALSGVLSFNAGSIVLPPVNSDVLTLSTSFSLGNSSFLRGFDNIANHSLLFDTTALSGEGIALAQLILVGDRYQITSVTYIFQPQATPEPATLLLLGTGLAGIAAARRRARQ